MNAPRWSQALVRRMAPSGREEEVVGDLEEAHRARARRRGRRVASLLTGLEALEMAGVLLRERVRARYRVRKVGGLPSGSPVGTPGGLGISSLDFKLGFRMLLRYPGMTVLAGLAMAFAIFVGAGTFEFFTQVGRPNLPFPDGDRVVGLRLWDTALSRSESRASFDFSTWREELESITDMGVFGTAVRNLVSSASAGPPVTVAEISASGFTVTRIPPQLGRTLHEEDERPGAPPVVVLGHEIWEDRFGSDPEVIGKTVRLGREQRTVVGVMPEGFGFPVAHRAWIPLDPNTLAFGPRDGPGIQVFGRLAAGVTLTEAQAELTVVGDRMALEFPETHGSLQPQVMPYARSILGIPGSISSFIVTAMIMSSNLPPLLFLVLVGGNIALLMFARAAARESEMVVRSALGASRSRIVAQLFAEALVLTTLAALVGLSAVNLGLKWAFRLAETQIGPGQLPFWFAAGLSSATIVYACLLTLLGAGIAGVLPALKVTRGVGAKLRRASASGGGFRFGGLWTAVIVSQIAVTIVFPVVTIIVRQEGAREITEEIDFAALDYLTARVEMDRNIDPGLDSDSIQRLFSDQYRTLLEDLRDGLMAEPQVAAVTYAERLPRTPHLWRQIEVDGPSAPPQDERGHRLGRSSVEVDFFRTLGVDILSGRDFDYADLTTEPGVVIVNESFVGRILGGRNPIGQRIRYIASDGFEFSDQEPGPWHEIIGVVEDLGRMSGYGTQGVYHPVAVGEIYPVYVAIDVRGDSEAFSPILSSVAVGVDPALRVHEVMTLAQVTDAPREFYRIWDGFLVIVTAVALWLSLGSIYAIMSFTVSQRTREIGIRVALGSSRRRIVGTIMRRPTVQVGIGVLCGGGLLAALFLTAGEGISLSELGLLAVYVPFMMAVCMLASIVPTRRALAVEPSVALRADG